MRKLAPARVSYQYDFFISYGDYMLFTWWLGHFIPRYLKVHFMLMKQTWDSTLRMRYPLQSTGRPISHRNVWSFPAYMIQLRDFVPEWNSRPQYNNLGELTPGYHVNKCRAMRGNRSGLMPAPKSLRCHVNTPLRWRFLCSDWCAHLARLRFPLLLPSGLQSCLFVPRFFYG